MLLFVVCCLSECDRAGQLAECTWFELRLWSWVHTNNIRLVLQVTRLVVSCMGKMLPLKWRNRNLNVRINAHPRLDRQLNNGLCWRGIDTEKMIAKLPVVFYVRLLIDNFNYRLSLGNMLTDHFCASTKREEISYFPFCQLKTQGDWELNCQ